MAGRSESPAMAAAGRARWRGRRPWASSLMTVVILVALMIPGTSVPQVGFQGIDLVVHLLMFAAWGAAVQWEWSPRWWVLLGVGVAFALGTELAQTLAVQRSFSLSDIAADIVGISLGATVAQVVRRRLLQAAEQG